MSVYIYLIHEDFKEYTHLLSEDNKDTLICYLDEQINEANKDFESAYSLEEKNNCILENAKDSLKNDFFQNIENIVNKKNKKNIHEYLKNMLIIVFIKENKKYVFVKEFVRNFVILSKKELSFKRLRFDQIDSIELISENSMNIPLDWDFSIELNDNIIYIQKFQKIKKWLSSPPEEEIIKAFNKFVVILKTNKIKFKSENFGDYIINKQRQKDLILMSNVHFSLTEIKKFKLIDKNDYLYKTKINEVIAYIVDKLHFSGRKKVWYASDSQKEVTMGDGKH